MSKATNTAEQAVRTYLGFLADPDSAVDQTAVDAATEAYEAETDPLTRLTLHAAIQEAREVNGEAITADFVKHALAFAEEKGISAVSFMEVHGVPRKVLKAAGFKKIPRSTSPSGPRVSRDAIEAGVPDSGEFTIRQVQEATGASNAAVRKLFGELVEDGTLSVVGPDPSHEGKGKPPVLYTRAS